MRDVTVLGPSTLLSGASLRLQLNASYGFDTEADGVLGESVRQGGTSGNRLKKAGIRRRKYVVGCNGPFGNFWPNRRNGSC